MRVLIYETVPETAAALTYMLEGERMVVHQAADPEDLLSIARTTDYDIIIMESSLPALRALRRAGVQTPVLVVSALPDVPIESEFIHSGADDYIRKPFHNSVLLARLHRVTQRAAGHPEERIRLGNVEIDLHQQSVRVRGVPVHLTRSEYSILHLLTMRLERTVSKEHIMSHLYDGRDEPELKIVDVLVCKIRRKLRAAGADDHLVTVWGRGYSLRAEPEPGARTRFTGPRISARDRILFHLRDRGPTRMDDVRRAMRSDHVVNVLYRLVVEGLASRFGSRGDYIYSINRVGHEYLEGRQCPDPQESEPVRTTA